VVCDQIPKVDYRTLLDKYVDCCFALQVLTLLASAVAYDCADMPLVGPHVNLIFFSLEFLAAALFHEWMFVRLHNHELDIESWVKAAGPDTAAEQLAKARKASRLVWAIVRIFGSNGHEDLNDGHVVEDDAEHFSTFGASIVANSASNLIKKQLIQDKIEEHQVFYFKFDSMEILQPLCYVC
jgi:hypothetical protein